MAPVNAGCAGSEGAPLSSRGPGQSCSPASLCRPRPPTPRVLMLGHRCTQRGLCSPRVLFGPERPHPTGLQFLGGIGDPPASSSARQQPCAHAWGVLPSGPAFREPTSPIPSPVARSVPCPPHTKVGTGYQGQRLGAGAGCRGRRMVTRQMRRKPAIELEQLSPSPASGPSPAQGPTAPHRLIGPVVLLKDVLHPVLAAVREHHDHLVAVGTRDVGLWGRETAPEAGPGTSGARRGAGCGQDGWP